MTPEGKLKAKVKKLLANYDKLYTFMPVPTMYQAASVDFFICYLGRFIAIETKIPGKRVTPRQSFTMRKITEAGGQTFKVSNDDELDGLKAYLDNLY